MSPFFLGGDLFVKLQLLIKKKSQELGDVELGHLQPQDLTFPGSNLKSILCLSLGYTGYVKRTSKMGQVMSQTWQSVSAQAILYGGAGTPNLESP